MAHDPRARDIMRLYVIIEQNHPSYFSSYLFCIVESIPARGAEDRPSPARRAMGDDPSVSRIDVSGHDFPGMSSKDIRRGFFTCGHCKAILRDSR